VPPLPDGVTTVREAASSAGGLPWHPIPGWSRFPWAIHGTTGAGPDTDLGLWGSSPAGEVLARWHRLQTALGAPAAVHSRQVHGTHVLTHDASASGLLVTSGYDGHTTDRPAILLTVSVADCVPVFLLDPGRRRVGLLHAGWRGTARGIIEAGLAAMGSEPGVLHAHLGPAICGACYEVGGEVHEALGLPAPGSPTPVDLRAAQARRLVDAGVPAGQITVSDHCTRCGHGFYSHRGGSRGRQLGVLAIR
jgi:YfiH family protein